MTPEQLKACILKYAMEGKLVEQFGDDGNAEDLYLFIIKQKQDLIRKGIIKKTKTLERISEEEIPFDIPTNWKWVRLIDLCETIGDVDHNMPKTVDTENGYPFLSAKDINENYSLNFTDNVKHISKDDFDKLRVKMQPRKNDIIFSRIGSLGKIGIVQDDRDFLVSYSCCVIRPIGVNLHYLKFFLEGPQIQAHIRRAKTGIGVPDLGMATIKGIPVPLPPLAEQHRIVAKIEELLPYVDRYAEAYEKLEEFNAKFPEEMKKSILQYAIEGRLVEQRAEEGTAEELYKQIQSEKQKLIKEGKIKKEKPLPEISEDEIPFDIPESWKWVRLNDIVYNHGQKTPDNVFSYIDIGSIDNVHQRLNDEETLIEAEKAPSRARKIVKFDDILYATVRPYLHNTCIIDREFKAEPIASTGFAVLTCHKGLFNKYLFYYLLSPVFDRYANSTDNAKGMAYPAINDNKLYRGVVPLPPLAEQRRIVARIEELLPLCERLAECREKAKA